jgi:hypothetical protein
MGVKEFSERVLELAPSTAKKPLQAVRSHLRYEHAGQTLVFLDSKTILPMRLALRGVRFRVPLSRRDVKEGMLPLDPWFVPILPYEIALEEVRLTDAQDRPLPTRPMTKEERGEGLFGPTTVERVGFDLSEWFAREGVRRNDYVLVTVEDWERGHFRLEHERAKRVRRQEVEGQDRELAELLFEMLERARDDTIFAHVAVPTAYARLSTSRGYPGSHWTEVVNSDDRMRSDGITIRYGDTVLPLEMMFARVTGETVPVPQQRFSRSEGEQVYRFKAALWHRRSLWRVIEVEGKQTLAEFDLALRDAFEHDTFDHMSGFWQLKRRGRGKRVREVNVGDVNPMGEGSGAEVAVAGLGLEPGDELKYVYDFGDWIEHRLTLQEIVEPEPDADYPRIVDRNKPKYQNCEVCEGEGRETRATWVCLECSNRQERGVLLCKDCVVEDHADHHVERILY